MAGVAGKGVRALSAVPVVTLLDHAALVAALRDAKRFSHPVSKIEVIETHISSVILTGDYAYKLKKPVVTGFVDFSTALARREACAQELRLRSEGVV